jgi:NAD+-dependent protein deacetylase SIR2
MGQEESRVVGDDVEPQTLRERNLGAVAELIKDGRAKRIAVLTGAGISTAAGIPDFRSPNTGLYVNLARLNLPYAEAVFDISYFRQNPEPFYLLAQELYPGKFFPTVSHVFIALLAAKGLLLQLFTQNIDCLESRAGVPRDLIVEAHGSFATQRCIECGKPYPDDEMKGKVERGEVPRCGDFAKARNVEDEQDGAGEKNRREGCGGLVKPDIVFFGESLPPLFRERAPMLHRADILLIIGTSLSVHPFAGLPQLVQDHCPRVLFNLERVGGIGGKADDVVVLQDCDSGIRQLADALGWRDELEAEWRKIVGEQEAKKQLRGIQGNAGEMEVELEKITERVEKGLTLEEDKEDEKPTDGRSKALSDHLDRKAAAIGRLAGEGEEAPAKDVTTNETSASKPAAAETRASQVETEGASADEVSSARRTQEQSKPSDDPSKGSMQQPKEESRTADKTLL